MINVDRALTQIDLKMTELKDGMFKSPPSSLEQMYRIIGRYEGLVIAKDLLLAKRDDE